MKACACHSDFRVIANGLRARTISNHRLKRLNDWSTKLKGRSDKLKEHDERKRAPVTKGSPPNFNECIGHASEVLRGDVGRRRSLRREGYARAFCGVPLKALSIFTNQRDIPHEVLVICLSYAFVGCGAWNDGLLGFAPSPISRSAEWFMAALLTTEIASRLALTRKRSASFWAVLSLDALSVLTVLPGLLWVSVFRLVRVVYAAGRLIALLDRIARRSRNPLYLVSLYPFVIPLSAAVVLALERHEPSSPIHNYLQAISVCFAFALSLGNIRPVSGGSMAICGTLFLLGIICIGVLTNALSSRYSGIN